MAEGTTIFNVHDSSVAMQTLLIQAKVIAFHSITPLNFSQAFLSVMLYYCCKSIILSIFHVCVDLYPL